MTEARYFIPDHSIRMALKTAALSGLDVRVQRGKEVLARVVASVINMQYNPATISKRAII